MTIARQKLGARAEQLATRRLVEAGWRIVERNARTRYGELDIIALDGRELVFIEVKATRAGAPVGPEHPVLAVGHQKQRRIRRLAGAYLGDRPPLPSFAGIRFDVIGISYEGSHVAAYEHIEGAF